jgi:maleylacetoacetate isomerase
VRALALSIACDIHPLNNLRVLNYLRSPLGHDDDAVNAWYRHWIGSGFRALEQEVSRTSGDGRHMFGSAVTLADIFIVPQMYNARRFNCDVEPYPKLRGICAHLETLPAFAKAVPEAQPEAS